MITKLRRKFIAIAMCSIALVLTVILIGIIASSYLNVCRNADARIQMIAENGGRFDPQEQPGNVGSTAPGRGSLTAESA
jgi:hypothetical protein